MHCVAFHSTDFFLRKVSYLSSLTPTPIIEIQFFSEALDPHHIFSWCILLLDLKSRALKSVAKQFIKLHSSTIKSPMNDIGSSCNPYPVLQPVVGIRARCIYRTCCSCHLDKSAGKRPFHLQSTLYAANELWVRIALPVSINPFTPESPLVKDYLDVRHFLRIIKELNINLHFKRNICKRNVDQKSTHKSPIDILWIHDKFQNYFHLSVLDPDDTRQGDLQAWMG